MAAQRSQEELIPVKASRDVRDDHPWHKRETRHEIDLAAH
jgi:hypothetical protein